MFPVAEGKELKLVVPIPKSQPFITWPFPVVEGNHEAERRTSAPRGREASNDPAPPVHWQDIDGVVFTGSGVSWCRRR